MDYQRGNMAEFLMGPDARRVCTLAAGVALARARAIVGKDSGETAASGRLQQHSTGGQKNDRVRVSVVFGEAAPSQQFGPRGSRFLTRAFEGRD